MALVEEVSERWNRPLYLGLLCEFRLELSVLFVKIEDALTQVIQTIVGFANLLLKFMVADVFCKVSGGSHRADNIGDETRSCCCCSEIHDADLYSGEPYFVFSMAS